MQPGGGVKSDPNFFSQSWVEKSTKSGPKSDIFEKLTVLGDSKLHFEWFGPKIDPSDPPSGTPQKSGSDLTLPARKALWHQKIEKNRSRGVAKNRKKIFLCVK